MNLAVLCDVHISIHKTSRTFPGSIFDTENICLSLVKPLLEFPKMPSIQSWLLPENFLFSNEQCFQESSVAVFIVSMALFTFTAFKVSILGVILVSIFSCSVRMRENVDQNNLDYGHFSRSVTIFLKRYTLDRILNTPLKSTFRTTSQKLVKIKRVSCGIFPKNCNCYHDILLAFTVESLSATTDSSDKLFDKQLMMKRIEHFLPITLIPLAHFFWTVEKEYIMSISENNSIVLGFFSLDQVDTCSIEILIIILINYLKLQDFRAGATYLQMT